MRCVRVIRSSVHFSSFERDRRKYTLEIRKFILINSITSKQWHFICEYKNIGLFSLFYDEYDNLWNEFNVNTTLSFSIPILYRERKLVKNKVWKRDEEGMGEEMQFRYCPSQFITPSLVVTIHLYSMDSFNFSFAFSTHSIYTLNTRQMTNNVLERFCCSLFVVISFLCVRAVLYALTARAHICACARISRSLLLLPLEWINIHCFTTSTIKRIFISPGKCLFMCTKPENETED